MSTTTSSRSAASKKKAATPESLAGALLKAVAARGCESRTVLPVVAAMMSTLGAPALYEPAWRKVAASGESSCALRSILQIVSAPVAFASMNRWEHATSALLEHLPDEELGCELISVVLEHDLAQLSSQAEGDLLGRVYTQVMAAADRSYRGAFYTPASVAGLIAEMLGQGVPDARVHDPACGAGSLVIATARRARAAGQDLTQMHFEVADLDALALSLAVVALSAHGAGSITALHQDSLANPLSAPRR